MIVQSAQKPWPLLKGNITGECRTVNLTQKNKKNPQVSQAQIQQ